MSLDVTQLSKQIASAFKTAFAKKWPDIKEYGQTEARKLAHTLAMIEVLKTTGKINEEQARLHLEIQKNASRAVMLTLKGLGLLAVEAALNAALDSVKTSVNTAVGFALL